MVLGFRQDDAVRSQNWIHYKVLVVSTSALRQQQSPRSAISLRFWYVKDTIHGSEVTRSEIRSQTSNTMVTNYQSDLDIIDNPMERRVQIVLDVAFGNGRR